MTDLGLIRLLAVIAEEYRVEFSEGRRAVWRVALADTDDETAMRGLAAHLRGARAGFQPRPGDVLVHVEREADEEADLAIVHLERHISDHQIVDLGPVLNAVVRSMGGPDTIVALMGTIEWKFRRPEARRLYLLFRRRGVSALDAIPQAPMAVLESEANRSNWRVDPAAFPAPIPREARFLPGQTRPALTGSAEG